MDITGCGTAIVTPFRADGSIDEQALRSLVNWQIDSGIDFLVACGSTGEAATLDEDEWLKAVCLIADAAGGRVPVWAGCTHNSTRTLVRQAALLRQVRGISAVLSANPYYNKPTQEGQYQHFLALAKAVYPLPVALYNVPGRTAANLEPATAVRLAEAAPNIQAIKEAKRLGAKVFGVVGRATGYTAQVGDAVVVVPVADPARVTPHSEAFQAVVWHCLVSNPILQLKGTKWETMLETPTAKP